MRFNLIYSICIATSLHSCLCQFNSDIDGSYTGNAKNNIDTLIIYESGEYERFLYRRNDERLIYYQKGAWKFTGNDKIYFRDFFIDTDQVYPDPYSFSSVLVDATFDLSKMNGSIHINYSPWEAVELNYTRIEAADN